MAVPPRHPDSTEATGKRKKPSDVDAFLDPKTKKQCSSAISRDTTATSPNPQTAVTCRPHEQLIAQLGSHYDIKTLSVLTSTKISKHIDKVLKHLGRFDTVDASVLPGVVLLYGKAEAASKVITISETVRRRIAEAEQKWYLYNVLSEVEVELAAARCDDLSIANDTALFPQEVDDDVEEEGDDEFFETMRQAVEPTRKTRQQAFFSIFLSCLPVLELGNLFPDGVQTNEASIEYTRSKRISVKG
jgi:hypothetical protein